MICLPCQKEDLVFHRSKKIARLAGSLITAVLPVDQVFNVNISGVTRNKNDLYYKRKLDPLILNEFYEVIKKKKTEKN